MATDKPSRGRPKDIHKQEEQKQKLIDAARILMREKSYRSVTIRDIGAAAGVNSAMVNYYFGGKETLFHAAIHDMTLTTFSQISDIINVEKPIRPFMEFIVKTMNEDKGLAKFIHDEILNENYPFRDKFLAGFPSKVAELLPQLVERELAAHQISSSINVKYAAFNLMSMMIMPYLASPIRIGSWKIQDTELCEEQWIEHLYQQFMHGILRD